MRARRGRLARITESSDLVCQRCGGSGIEPALGAPDDDRDPVAEVEAALADMRRRESEAVAMLPPGVAPDDVESVYEGGAAAEAG